MSALPRLMFPIILILMLMGSASGTFPVASAAPAVGPTNTLASPPAVSDQQTGLSWTAWQDLGGTLTSAPTAVSWGRERVAVFARGGNGEIVQTYREGAGSWTPWQTPGELQGIILRSAPSCASWTDGTINCVALREGYGGVFTGMGAVGSPAILAATPPRRRQSWPGAPDASASLCATATAI